MKNRSQADHASIERRRRAEIVRLIITTREKFPHSPRWMNALRRVMWRYAAPAPRSAPTKPKR
jgi:hypothetical protein